MMKIKYWETAFWEKFKLWFSGQYNSEFKRHKGGRCFERSDIYRAYNEGFRQGRLRGRREMREESQKKCGAMQ